VSRLPRLIVLYARRSPAQTLLVSLSIAVALALPVTGRALVSRYESRLSARARSVPLVVGSAGSRFDLALSAVYFRRASVPPVPMGVYDELAAEGRVTPVGLHARFTSRGRTVVSVSPEYFEWLGLRPSVGTLPLVLGEAVLGARAARELGLAVGDEIVTDRRELYDLSVPPPVALRVVGVLAEAGTPDDAAVFTSLDTAWLLEGLSHGHEDAASLSGDDVLASTPDLIAVRPTLETRTRVSPGQELSVHLHGDPAALPLTAVLLFDESEKDLTIVGTRLDAGEHQTIRPAELVAELFEVVFRLRPIFDAIAALLGTTTLLLIVLSSVLAARLREGEFAALRRIGAPRGTVAVLILGQSLVVIALGAVAAAGLIGLALLLASHMLPV
jgi:putative ABC transport system permease protein